MNRPGELRDAVSFESKKESLFLQTLERVIESCLTDIFDESVSLLSLKRNLDNFAKPKGKQAFITLYGTYAHLRHTPYGCGVLFIWV